MLLDVIMCPYIADPVQSRVHVKRQLELTVGVYSE